MPMFYTLRPLQEKVSLLELRRGVLHTLHRQEAVPARPLHEEASSSLPSLLQGADAHEFDRLLGAKSGTPLSFPHLNLESEKVTREECVRIAEFANLHCTSFVHER